jgi:carbonic anhydrase
MYTILNFHWTPNQFNELNRKEKAFVIACIDERVQAEKQEQSKLR